MSGPNGILSDSDLRYLASLDSENEDVWDGNENQKRYRMRRKIQAALRDFPGIAGLPSHEYELILKDLDDTSRGYRQETLDEKTGETITTDWEADKKMALRNMLMFVYKACELEPTIDFSALVEDAISLTEYKWLNNNRSGPEGVGPITLGGKLVENVDVSIHITIATSRISAASRIN